MKRLYLFLALVLIIAGANAYAGTAFPDIERSGTITTGGTFQSITNPTGVRYSLDFMNICSVSGNCDSTSDVCYIYFGAGTATVANSLPLTAGQEYLRASGVIPNDTVQVTCTTTGDKFYLKFQ